MKLFRKKKETTTKNLHHICESNSPNIDDLKKLIENKADVNQRDKYQKIPLMYACNNKVAPSFEVIKYLVEINSDLNAADVYSGHCLHYLCDNEKSTLEMIQLLVDKKADLNATDESKNNPLLFCCSIEKPSIEKALYLIEMKSNVNHLNNYKENALGLFIDENNHIKQREFEILFRSFLCHGFDLSLLNFSMIKLVRISETDLLDKYDQGKLWSVESHQLFPRFIREQILCWMMCAKTISNKLNQIFPKPLVKMIGERMVDLYLKRKMSV